MEPASANLKQLIWIKRCEKQPQAKISISSSISRQKYDEVNGCQREALEKVSDR